MKKKKKTCRGEPQKLWKDLFHFHLSFQMLENWMLRCVTLFIMRDKNIMKTQTLTFLSDRDVSMWTTKNRPLHESRFTKSNK